MNKRLIQIIIILLLIIAVSVAIYYRDFINVDLLEQWLDQAGWWAPAIFIVLYISATVLFLPGSVFTLAGGVFFGPYLGILYNLTGATIGAALSFLIARYLASDFVSQQSGGRLKQLINGVEAEGWRFVAFVRLVPLFPFNLLNYALGLTKIRFSEYVLASFIFMLPGAAAYTYIGYAGRNALSGGDGLIKNILIALALLAVALFLPRFVATLRRGPSIDIDELKQRLDEQVTLVLDVRSDKEFHADGHIDDALNIPVEVLDQQLSKLETYKTQSISIVCKTDKRSAVAANVLLKHGFEDVRVVRGGMTDWNKQ
ncbi:MAG: sulfurtransferase [Thiotrichaceae bacterium]|nr:MAG: sulfurtransferase [Thiotrichaceae bacterium]